MPSVICARCKNEFEAVGAKPGTGVVCPKCQALNQLPLAPKPGPKAGGRVGPKTKPEPKLEPELEGASTEEVPAVVRTLKTERSVSLAGRSDDTLIVGAGTQAGGAVAAFARPVSRKKTREDYLLPEALGPYEILGEIGHGGMGIILQAHDEALKRQVAIKVLHPENREDPIKRLRFIKEAQITGQLEHPGIAPVHYLGWDEAGNEFFSMKLVSGVTLDAILNRWHSDEADARAEYPLPRLISIFERVCETVGFAHACGVIHRDLKPSNVIIGKHGEVWVLDWGLAKVLGAEDDARAAVTRDNKPGQGFIRPTIAEVRTLDGVVVGTPEYMAPEQATGEPLDEGVDIFALGALLYEVLTSKPPHAGTTVNEVVSRAADGVVTPVRRTPLGKNAPEGLAAICEKCMSPQRADRYANVGELLHDLRAYAADREIGALPDTPWRRVMRFSRRHRRAVRSGVLLATLFLVTITVAAIVIAQKEVEVAQTQNILEQQRARALQAELDKQTAITANAERARLRLKAFEYYAQAMDLLMRGQKPEAAQALLDQALQIDPDFPEAQFFLAEAQRMCGLPRQAAESYLKADVLNRRILDRANLQAIIAAGFAYDGAGEYEKAQQAFTQAESLGASDPLALVGRTFCLVHRRRLKEAGKVAEQALRDGAHLWETHFAVGYVLLESLKEGLVHPELRATAIHEAREALRLGPRQAEAYVWLAVMLAHQGTPEELREAMKLHDQAIELEPLNGCRYYARALAYINRRDLERAERDFEQARKLQASPTLLLSFEVRRALARGDDEEAYRLVGELVQKTHMWPSVVQMWLHLGFKLKRFDEVQPVYQQWCRDYAHSPMVAVLRTRLKLNEADYRGAVDSAQEGLQLAPYCVELHVMLAQALERQSRFQEALAAADKTLKLSPGDMAARRVHIKALVGLERYEEVLEELARLEKARPDEAEQIAKWRAQVEQLRQ